MSNTVVYIGNNVDYEAAYCWNIPKALITTTWLETASVNVAKAERSIRDDIC